MFLQMSFDFSYIQHLLSLSVKYLSIMSNANPQSPNSSDLNSFISKASHWQLWYVPESIKVSTYYILKKNVVAPANLRGDTVEKELVFHHVTYFH